MTLQEAVDAFNERFDANLSATVEDNGVVAITRPPTEAESEDYRYYGIEDHDRHVWSIENEAKAIRKFQELVRDGETFTHLKVRNL